MEVMKLYHATYGPLLDSIAQYGLGARTPFKNWKDSKEGVVYLATSPDIAISYAEISENAPNDYLDDIVVLEIDGEGLKKNRLFIDTNVLDNNGDTLEYHGVISFDFIRVIKPLQTFPEQGLN
jgi:hypothetical protein